MFPIPQKIDFTTLKKVTGIPVEIHEEPNAGSDTHLSLIRLGGIVIANGSFVTSGIGSYDAIDIGNVIPSGWRPSQNFHGDSGVWIPFSCTMASELGLGAWQILPNGHMKFSNGRGFSGARRFAYSCVYFTDDEWPTS